MSERTRTELIAWAAGLFEGEGCITATNLALTVRMTNTDRELLDRFIDVVEVGTIYGPYDRSNERDGYTRKPVFCWVAQALEALEVLEVLSPWLSERRLTRAYELTEIRFPCGMGSLRHG